MRFANNILLTVVFSSVVLSDSGGAFGVQDAARQSTTEDDVVESPEALARWAIAKLNSLDEESEIELALITEDFRADYVKALFNSGRIKDAYALASQIRSRQPKDEAKLEQTESLVIGRFARHVANCLPTDELIELCRTLDDPQLTLVAFREKRAEILQNSDTESLLTFLEWEQLPESNEVLCAETLTIVLARRQYSIAAKLISLLSDENEKQKFQSVIDLNEAIRTQEATQAFEAYKNLQEFSYAVRSEDVLDLSLCLITELGLEEALTISESIEDKDLRTAMQDACSRWLASSVANAQLDEESLILRAHGFDRDLILERAVEWALRSDVLEKPQVDQRVIATCLELADLIERNEHKTRAIRRLCSAPYTPGEDFARWSEVARGQNKKLFIMRLINISNSLIDQERHDEAWAVLKRSILRAKELEEDVSRDDAFQSCCSVLCRLGEHDRALELVNYVDRLSARQFGVELILVSMIEVGKSENAVEILKDIDVPEHKESAMTRVIYALGHAGEYDRLIETAKLWPKDSVDKIDRTLRVAFYSLLSAGQVTKAEEVLDTIQSAPARLSPQIALAERAIRDQEVEKASSILDDVRLVAWKPGEGWEFEVDGERFVRLSIQAKEYTTAAELIQSVGNEVARKRLWCYLVETLEAESEVETLEALVSRFPRLAELRSVEDVWNARRKVGDFSNVVELLDQLDSSDEYYNVQLAMLASEMMVALLEAGELEQALDLIDKPSSELMKCSLLTLVAHGLCCYDEEGASYSVLLDDPRLRTDFSEEEKRLVRRVYRRLNSLDPSEFKYNFDE